MALLGWVKVYQLVERVLLGHHFSDTAMFQKHLFHCDAPSLRAHRLRVPGRYPYGSWAFFTTTLSPSLPTNPRQHAFHVRVLGHDVLPSAKALSD